MTALDFAARHHLYQFMPVVPAVSEVTDICEHLIYVTACCAGTCGRGWV